MFKELSSAFSFLTILPFPGTSLEKTAKYMFLFPLVGIAIGLLVGGFGWGLSEFLEPLIVSLLVVTGLAILTGIHHTDGLADFSDGLMVKGTKEKKLQAMKDVSTGSAGITALVLYFIGMVITISLTSGFELFKAILISEILAKFSMVLISSVGTSASIGSNSTFLQEMKDKRKLLIAFLIMIIPIILIGEMVGFFMLITTVLITFFVLFLSKRSFGGITGDVIGTSNELSRLASLMVFVSI